MSSQTTSAEPRHIPPPEMRDDRPYCPRCHAMLRFEHDEYVCVACGYEYLLEPRDLEIIRQSRRGVRRAAAILAFPLAGIPLGGGFAVVAGLLVAGFIVSGWAKRRKRSRLTSATSVTSVGRAIPRRG